MLYVFNVWVSLFSITLFSQGWLVAANVFDSREAKRLYGLLGLGAVAGAAIGSAVTTFTVKIVGTQNLILACAVMVLLAFGAFLGAVRQRGEPLVRARAADAEKLEFSARDIFSAVARYRHLQVIIAIILLTFIVDELVDFQFQAMAKHRFRGDQLTAFFGGFYVYLNLISLVLQLFFTAWVVRRVGVGGTLQIMPVSITVASLAAAAVPGLVSAIVLRFSEAVNRYTFNRTGMELLFLPLPSGLKNRTKAFVDIFVDRFGRGIAGILLAAMLWAGLRDMRIVAMLTLVFTGTWILLARIAQREYTGTVRSRIERRRLELEDARLTVGDPATLRLLEQTVECANARQACYALSMLAEAPGYDLAPLLCRLSTSPLLEVRAKVYAVAGSIGSMELLAAALAEIQTPESQNVKPAVAYVLAVSPEAAQRAAAFLNHVNGAVVDGVIEALEDRRELAREVLTPAWIAAAAADADPERRRMAASAMAVRAEETAALVQLLEDPEPRVVVAACRAAGRVGSRVSLDRIVHKLDDPALRSVDVLLKALARPELSIRAAVLRALSHLRQTAPRLDYGETFVTEQILHEARHYFDLYSALEPFRSHKDTRTATGLLTRALEERLQQTIERLFHLLGLRYPPEDMHAAYLAVRQRRREQFLAALDFLDTVLERPLKRVLLPLLDSSEGLAERGRDLFGVEIRDAEAAVRDLIRSPDPWLAACAMAAAAEQKFYRLAPDIVAAEEGAGTEVLQVARSAMVALRA
jgi:AAA family ATP:ADP antiporter